MERTLVGLSQLLKVVEKLWLVGHKFANLGTEFLTYQSFATDLSNCDRPIRVLSTTLSNPIRVLFSALQLWSPLSASCWTLGWKTVTVKQYSYTRDFLRDWSPRSDFIWPILFLHLLPEGLPHSPQYQMTKPKQHYWYQGEVPCLVSHVLPSLDLLTYTKKGSRPKGCAEMLVICPVWQDSPPTSWKVGTPTTKLNMFFQFQMTSIDPIDW